MRAAILIAVISSLGAGAGAEEELVPFVIPAKVHPDSLLRLAPSPAIPPDGERIVARDGHFVLGQRRVRIWGVNFCFGADFPRPDDAERIAERLAAFGINSVRFHHMDSTAFPRGIWDPKDPRRLSPQALDRLDYFIDRLARRGICANLNLHVSRTHSRVLRLPDAERLPNYDKIVDIFTPALIEAQEAYARDLLTHVNKYRKVRYADDPAVAFVEISNEDSLFMWGAERTLPALPLHYAGILRERYAAWLKARYGTTERLREAWGRGAEPLGENLLTDPAFRQVGKTGAGGAAWRLEEHEGCLAKTAPTAEGVRLEIVKADATGWHITFKHERLALQAGRYYTLSFRARSDKPRSIGFGVGQAGSPWKMLGLSSTTALDDKWRTVRAGFVASADEGNARAIFQVGGSDAAVELADARLQPGGREGLREGESVEKRSVPVFAESETEPRTLDRWRFLAETEKAFYDGMRRFIRNDLGCKALVTGTIVFGPCGLYGQSDMDYVDTHAYWQHPRFPGRPWDPDNWLVEQRSVVDHPEESPLLRLAASRLAGKPFTVSEYNHPAPNDCQAECVPVIASFAAAHDWDGVWLFAYSHRTDDWERNCFSGFFDIDHNPAKWGFVPAGTVIFRDAGMNPLGVAALVIALSDGRDVLGDLAGLHRGHGLDMLGVCSDLLAESIARPFVESGAMNVAVAMTPAARARWPEVSPADGALGSHGSASMPAGSYAFTHDRGAFVLIVRGHAGPPDAEVEVSSPAFAAFVAVALDGKALDESRRVLVTACGRCENQGMRFSQDRRTVGRNWGTAPVGIEPVKAILRCAFLQEGKWRCQALAPDGRPGAEVALESVAGKRQVVLSPGHRTMWYLLTRE